MYRFIKISIQKQKFKFIIRNTSTSNAVLSIKDMPHPKTIPVIGTKLDILLHGRGTKLHEYIDWRHKQLGPIFYDKLGGSNEIVFISNDELMKSVFINFEGRYPAHILPEPWVYYEKIYGSKRGLFFMNGEEWLNNRRIMNKYLLREGSEKWLKPMKRMIEKHVQNWKNKIKSGNNFTDLESELYRLSTDVIIAVLMGNNPVLKPSQHHEELLMLFTEAVKKIFQTTTKLYGLPIKICHHFNLKAWRDFKASVDMSLFLAQKIVSEMLSKREENNGLIKLLCQENISDETITRIVTDLIIAAGDTTAYTTLWTLFLIAKDNEVKNELRTKDHSYANFVVKESMRLYPVAPFLTRILPKECILGLYKLYKGTPIVASIYTAGRDENYYSKANLFLPYRWDRNDPRKKDLVNHSPSASLPFALGARSCIGKKIAMVQLTEIIKQMVDNFDVNCENSTEIDAVTSQVLVPSKPIEFSFSLRNK